MLTEYVLFNNSMIETVSFYDPNDPNLIDLTKMTVEEVELHYVSQLDNGLVQEEYEKEVSKAKKLAKRLKGENGLSYSKEFTKKEKVLWAKALQNENNPFYEYQKNTNIICNFTKNIQVATYKDAISYIKKINIIQLFGIETRGLSKNFSCGVMSDNIANVNVDDEGNWRYFTRDKDSIMRYSFDVIDITEIIYNVGYYEALNLLCETLEIEVKEGEWVMNQHVKYSKNCGKIYNADEDIAIRYPALYKFINKHLYVLKEMNAIGSANLLTEDDSLNGEAVFFTASRFIEAKLESQGIQKSHTSINKVINLFTVLGLVKKVPLEKVPSRLREQAKKAERMKAKQVVNLNIDGVRSCHSISFFNIPLLTTDVLLEAERRVMLLKKAKIKATGIKVTDENLKKTLGNEIFYSTIGHNELFSKRIEKAKVERKLNKSSLPF